MWAPIVIDNNWCRRLQYGGWPVKVKKMGIEDKLVQRIGSRSENTRYRLELKFIT